MLIRTIHFPTFAAVRPPLFTIITATMIDRGWVFYPALRPAVALALGIALERLFSPPVPVLMIGLAVMLVLIAYLIRRRENQGLGLLLVPLVMCVGMLHAVEPENPFDPFEGTLIRRGEIVGRIASDPVLRNGRAELLVECDSLIFRSASLQPSTLVQVVIGDTAGLARMRPRAGDHISAVGSLALPSAPRTPWDPDFRGYLKSRGIGLTANVASARSLYLFDRDDLSATQRFVVSCRRLAREFADSMVSGEEGDIVAALLVGDRAGIDSETRDVFSRTGTIHVLAVSGLHVGLIALILGVVLSWIPSRAAQLPLFLLALGLYVAIVGGGPSILRAAIMGGAFMGARLAGRISRPINTLAFAALLVLMIEPAQLFDIGFQLSFGSVAGIVLLAGALRSPEPPKRNPGMATRIARWLRDALWLSVSAQLLTLPLLLHHFGSLPTLSLPANLLVVPLTTGALGAGLAGTSLLGWLPSVAGWFGASVYLATTVALQVVTFCSQLPPGSIEIPTISTPAMLLLLLSLVYVALSRGRRQLLSRGMIWLLLLSLTLAVESRFDPLVAADRTMLYWYSAAEGSRVASVQNDTLRVFALADSMPSATEERLRRRVGASVLQMVLLDSISPSRGDLPMPINDTPKEFFLDPPGVVLSGSAQPEPGPVLIEGRTLLRLPLGRKPEQAIIVRSGKQWEVIRWR